MKRIQTPLRKGWADWLDANKNRRDSLVGLGVSCCVHLSIAFVLSLVAIGTGSVEIQSSLLVASTNEIEDEMILIPASDWQVTPDLPESPADAAAVSMELPALAQLSVAAGSAAKQLAPAPPTPEKSSQSPSAQAPANPSIAKENPLSGTPAQAVAAIQKRVSKAGGKQGEVQFALAWRNVNDVDLHVIAPSGEHISHVHRRSRCGGILDVDMNVEGESEEPVENVRWITHAPWGRYTVLVNFFKLNSEGVRRPRRQSPYQLLVQLGNESLLREAVAGFGEQQVTVWRFQYIPDSFSSLEREQLLKQLELLQSQEESAAAPMFQQAQAAEGSFRQRILQIIVQTYPHTDAAIEAMQLLEGEVVKRTNR